MALSKQQFAGAWKRKHRFCLDLKVNTKNLLVEDWPKYLRLEKLQPQIFLKMSKNCINNTNFFMKKKTTKKTSGAIAVVNIMSIIIFCMNSTRNAAHLTLKLETKNRLQKEEFENFNASDDWLNKWNATYAIKERRNAGAAVDE